MRTLLNRLNSYNGFIGRLIYLVIFLGVLSTFFESFGILMFLPVLMSLTGDEIDNPIIELQENLFIYLNVENNILNIIFLIAILFIFKGILMYVSLYLSAKGRGIISVKLRELIYLKFIKMSFSFFRNENQATFINLINEQVNRAVVSYDFFTKFIVQLFSGIILFLIAVIMIPRLGIIMIFTGLIIFYGFKSQSKKIDTISNSIQKGSIDLSNDVSQFLHQFKYLVATHQRDFFSEKISKQIELLGKNNKDAGIISGLTSTLREPISILALLLLILLEVVWFGGALITLFVVILIVYKSVNYLMSSQYLFQQFTEYSASLDLISNRLNSIEEEKITSSLNKIDSIEAIEIKDISFSYGDKPIIQNISLNMKKGYIYAISGRSGSGKSTFIDILVRINYLNSGSVFINSINIDDIDLNSLRSRVGYVTQDNTLFAGTILENIVGKFLDKKEINKFKNNEEFIKCIQQSGLAEFLEGDRLNNHIGDKAIKISGGQKQRIMIAKELYRNIDILLFDEATSALDIENQQIILDTLVSIKSDLIVLIIAHKESNLKIADYRYNLKNGYLEHV